MQTPPASTQATLWLENFHQLVLNNLGNPRLTNSTLAAQLYMSDRKLYRIIQKLTGQSPNQYIRSIRLRKAKEVLLTERGILVKQVAGKVGFIKVDYFSLLFKEEFGITPVELLRSKACSWIAQNTNFLPLKIKQMPCPDPEHQTIEWLEQFNQLIIRYLSDYSLTNDFLAAKLNISSRKLYRIVQNLTQQSPNHYIRHIRLQVAYQLLDSGHYLTVKEVAAKVGFKKTDYFTVLFKAKFGTTPVEVLKNG